MNWKDTIAELVRLGATQAEIAEAGNCSQAAVSMLANGKIKDPRDSIGQGIRQLLDAKRREAPPPPPDSATAGVETGG